MWVAVLDPPGAVLPWRGSPRWRLRGFRFFGEEPELIHVVVRARRAVPPLPRRQGPRVPPLRAHDVVAAPGLPRARSWPARRSTPPLAALPALRRAGSSPPSYSSGSARPPSSRPRCAGVGRIRHKQHDAPGAATTSPAGPRRSASSTSPICAVVSAWTAGSAAGAPRPRRAASLPRLRVGPARRPDRGARGRRQPPRRGGALGGRHAARARRSCSAAPGPPRTANEAGTTRPRWPPTWPPPASPHRVVRASLRLRHRRDNSEREAR